MTNSPLAPGYHVTPAENGGWIVWPEGHPGDLMRIIASFSNQGDLIAWLADEHQKMLQEDAPPEDVAGGCPMTDERDDSLWRGIHHRMNLERIPGLLLDLDERMRHVEAILVHLKIEIKARIDGAKADPLFEDTKGIE